MRSPKEIAFRLRQEWANLSLWLLPPEPDAVRTSPLPLPAPADFLALLRDTPYESRLLDTAERILEHRFPLLGIPELSFGPQIPWRRDPVHGQETGLRYFRRIPYLDFTRAGDHKLIWELSRHQHLVLLAQAWLLTRSAGYLAEIESQLDHWMQENPFQRGINWTSALEVAFRALSWLWIEHWIGTQLSPALHRRFLTSFYRHGCHLEQNLSVYFSPNTHLLGEAVVLHALGCLFAGNRRAAHWRNRGSSIAIEEMDRQVRPDGAHFEQSTYYHVYALDMFLFHALLNPDVPPSYRAKLARMAEYLDACLPPNQALPFLGDDDGGRFFHPYGARPGFALGALAAAGAFFQRPGWIRSLDACREQSVWWFGAPAPQSPPATAPCPVSRLFPDTGMAVLRAGNVHVLCDAGPFGALSAGHSHSDTLSIVATQGDEELLIDSGTFTYVSDPAQRAAFRGSAAHNTVRIDGLDQARPRNSFAWFHPPQVELLAWDSNAVRDSIDATCRYAGFTHRRTIYFHKPDFLLVLDRIGGGDAAPHHVEQFWHLPAPPQALAPATYAIGGNAVLLLSHPAEAVPGFRSRAFASREPSTTLRVTRHAAFPLTLAAAICFERHETLPQLRLESDDSVRLTTTRDYRIVFPPSGVPTLQT
jgi:hypothetical protein